MSNKAPSNDSPSSILEDGNLITNPAQVANSFDRFFKTIAEKKIIYCDH